MPEKPCCAQEAARKIRRISVGGVSIGFTNLDHIMETVYDEALPDQEAIRERLMELIRESNYIPAPSLQEYEDALFIEYCRLSGTTPTKRK